MKKIRVTTHRISLPRIRLEKMKPYEVEWDDCQGYYKWIDVDELRKNMIKEEKIPTCRSVGYYVALSKYFLAFAMLDKRDHDVGDRLWIPIGCIRRIRKLK